MIANSPMAEAVVLAADDAPHAEHVGQEGHEVLRGQAAHLGWLIIHELTSSINKITLN